MIYRIRVSDVPIFIIFMAIDLPLLAGFIELVKQGTVDIRGVSNWLLGTLFFGVMGMSLLAATFIWKHVREFTQRHFHN